MPNSLTTKRIPLVRGCEDYLSLYASSNDFNELIEPNTMILDEDFKTLGAFIQLDPSIVAPLVKIIRPMCSTYNEDKLKRLGIYDIIRVFGMTIMHEYFKHIPEQYSRITHLVGNNPIFIDCNFNYAVNEGNQIFYHRDTHKPCCFSTCLILRNTDEPNGGYLVWPEYDIAFRQLHGTLLMFNGLDIIHGVSTLNLKPKEYRVSTVWFPKAGMRG